MSPRKATSSNRVPLRNSVFDLERALKKANRSLLHLRMAKNMIILGAPIEDQLALANAFPDIDMIFQEHSLRDIVQMSRDLRRRIAEIQRDIKLHQASKVPKRSHTTSNDNGYGGGRFGGSAAGGLSA